MNDAKTAFLTGFWFFLLTFPILGVRVQLHDQEMLFHLERPLIVMALVTFVVFAYLRFGRRLGLLFFQSTAIRQISSYSLSSKNRQKLFLVLGLIVLVLPFCVSSYHNTVLITALMYVVLGLGLNIVVGLAGLLDLGYVAFYAVGAYGYALINMHLGLNFWLVLPLTGILAGLLGVLLGIPVLRLRGDYLAIVTLGFGEIIRIVLETWVEITQGPRGIYGIPKPGLFQISLDYEDMNIFLYYVILLMSIATIHVVRRLSHSRIGRAWVALREDEQACELMGINTTQVKLHAFGLGACWAGFVGAFFAAKNSFVNPASFTFHQSALILCIVILGGAGSIVGVVLASLILIITPEYLRFLEQYRMLFFGLTMVLVMVFKPEGLIRKSKVSYKHFET